MAGHNVTFSVPDSELGRMDLTFHVWADGEKLGTLGVSKGSVVWFPKSTTYGNRMSWERFDRLMQEHAEGEEKR